MKLAESGVWSAGTIVKPGPASRARRVTRGAIIAASLRAAVGWRSWKRRMWHACAHVVRHGAAGCGTRVHMSCGMGLRDVARVCTCRAAWGCGMWHECTYRRGVWHGIPQDADPKGCGSHRIRIPLLWVWISGLTRRWDLHQSSLLRAQSKRCTNRPLQMRAAGAAGAIRWMRRRRRR